MQCRENQSKRFDSRINTKVERRMSRLSSSGAAQHAKTCPLGPDFANGTMLKTENRHFERSVRESLEIQRQSSEE